MEVPRRKAAKLTWLGRRGGKGGSRALRISFSNPVCVQLGASLLQRQRTALKCTCFLGRLALRRSCLGMGLEGGDAALTWRSGALEKDTDGCGTWRTGGGADMEGRTEAG